MKKPSLLAKFLALLCFTLVMTAMIVYQVDHVFPHDPQANLAPVPGTDTDSIVQARIKAMDEQFLKISRPWSSMDSVTRMQRYQKLNMNDSMYLAAWKRMFIMSSSKIRVQHFETESDSLWWITRIYESLHPEAEAKKNNIR